MKVYMPAINTGDINSGSFKKNVEKGVYDFKNNKDEFKDYIGIIEERNEGDVSIYPVDSGVPGLTKIGRDYKGAKAEEIEISARLPDECLKRVTEHELVHVLTEKLFNYIDVDEGTARLILESIPEYGHPKFLKHKGKFREAMEIERTTPYPRSVKFGEDIEKYYVSGIDSKKGYKAFIRDIQKQKSMEKPFERFLELYKYDNFVN